VLGSANQFGIEHSRQAIYAQTSSLVAISWLLSVFSVARRACTARDREAIYLQVSAVSAGFSNSSGRCGPPLAPSPFPPLDTVRQQCNAFADRVT
jgi:hypothetical protein